MLLIEFDLGKKKYIHDFEKKIDGYLNLVLKLIFKLGNEALTFLNHFVLKLCVIREFPVSLIGSRKFAFISKCCKFIFSIKF